MLAEGESAYLAQAREAKGFLFEGQSRIASFAHDVLANDAEMKLA